MDKISAVYAIVNKETGKMYIGGSKDIKTRWRLHKADLNRGEHYNGELQEDWNKYGSNTFVLEILKKVQVQDLNRCETKYLKSLHPLYNIKLTANGGHFVPPETRRKMSFVKRQRGSNISQETRSKISRALKGNTFTKEHCDNISKALKGREFSEETKNKLSKSHTGEKHNRSKLTREDVIEIKEALRAGKKQTEIAKNYPVKRAAINKIATGRSWAHL